MKMKIERRKKRKKLFYFESINYLNFVTVAHADARTFYNSEMKRSNAAAAKYMKKKRIKLQPFV